MNKSTVNGTNGGISEAGLGRQDGQGISPFIACSIELISPDLENSISTEFDPQPAKEMELIPLISKAKATNRQTAMTAVLRKTQIGLMDNSMGE